MIKVDSIFKSYRNDFWAKKSFALKDVSFEIAEGKVTGFLGANGAGKTTMFKILMGFIKPDSGRVDYNLKQGETFRDILSKIGYFPERPYFYQQLKGLEFINYMGKLQGLSHFSIKKGISIWGERLSITHALNRNIRGYSKGMLQRLGFLSCLIHNPEIIFLDEPLAGLDPLGRKEFKDIIIELNKMGKTIYFSSHIIPDIEEVCEDVIFLDKGELIYKGKIDQFPRKDLGAKYVLRIKSSNKIEIQGKTIKNEVLPSGEVRIEVDKSDKDELIREILNKGYFIEALNPVRPDLENAIFNFNNND